MRVPSMFLFSNSLFSFASSQNIDFQFEKLKEQHKYTVYLCGFTFRLPNCFALKIQCNHPFGGEFSTNCTRNKEIVDIFLIEIIKRAFCLK